jgi:hypothetical protein
VKDRIKGIVAAAENEAAEKATAVAAAAAASETLSCDGDLHKKKKRQRSTDVSVSLLQDYKCTDEFVPSRFKNQHEEKKKRIVVDIDLSTSPPVDDKGSRGSSSSSN